jgi:hypothetical protein
MEESMMSYADDEFTDQNDITSKRQKAAALELNKTN